MGCESSSPAPPRRSVPSAALEQQEERRKAGKEGRLRPAAGAASFVPAVPKAQAAAGRKPINTRRFSSATRRGNLAFV